MLERFRIGQSEYLSAPTIVEKWLLLRLILRFHHHYGKFQQALLIIFVRTYQIATLSFGEAMEDRDYL